MNKGPFKMKKSPAKHTGMGMLGGRNTSNANNAVVGGNKPLRGNMLGALGGAINFPSVTGGGRNKRRGMGALNMFRNRKGMGALNTFRNRIKSIFG